LPGKGELAKLFAMKNLDLAALELPPFGAPPSTLLTKDGAGTLAMAAKATPVSKPTAIYMLCGLFTISPFNTTGLSRNYYP
jgi:hypothetical protein